jgi:tRNA (guanosine-2'-O-)-methyltransferase
MVFENPSNANNVWAALRTFDAFGLQFVDIILNEQYYSSEWRKGTMGAALGSQKWMTLQQHSNTTDCITSLKQAGYVILCTDLHSESLALPNVSWDKLLVSSEPNQPPRKIAIVLGNENNGITQEARKLCDHSLYIPMRGFAESLNLSVAAAVICATLSTKQLLPGNLNDNIKQRILLTWLARTVRGSTRILRHAGAVDVEGDNVYNSIGQVTTRP